MQSSYVKVVYQSRILRKRNQNSLALIATGFLVFSTGCTGLNNAIPQALGINSAARVPPPGTGSFATPTNYSNSSTGTAGSPAPRTTTPPAIGPKTSQFNPIEQPTGQLLSTLNNAQSKINQVTSQARDTVNRTADGIHSQVEAASGRIDRLGQGVVQASAIIAEAAQPLPTGNINDQDPNPITEDPNAAWRKPTR